MPVLNEPGGPAIPATQPPYDWRVMAAVFAAGVMVGLVIGDIVVGGLR